MADHSTQDSVPSHKELFNPVLKAIQALGGSASNAEIVNRVIEDLRLPDSVVEIPHKSGRMSRLEYRIGWAKTYLKKYGLLDNSTRGVWSLTAVGHRTESIDPDEVAKHVVEHDRVERQRRAEEADLPESEDISTGDPTEDIASWRDDLLKTLLNMQPAAFERLCQRILRESGFIEVNVTGQTGDGGIDGNGIIRLGGLISFPVAFQCKRYSGSVSSNTVRDFRGAMIGRAEKGLIITTGTFTRDAHKEATRDGAPPIDLIDGELLIDKLKELNLGVRVRTEEFVEVDTKWDGFSAS